MKLEIEEDFVTTLMQGFEYRWASGSVEFFADFHTTKFGIELVSHGQRLLHRWKIEGNDNGGFSGHSSGLFCAG